MGSCFFIGHRETPDRVYPTLLETIERHITEYGVSEFVVGRYGNFDRLVIRALSQAKRAHPDITLMLMTPYYPVNRKVDLPEAFDALFYPPDLETVPKRLAIVRANRYMVDHSDHVLAVWDGSFRSGSGQTVRYAQKMGKMITIIRPDTLEITREKQTNKANE